MCQSPSNANRAPARDLIALGVHALHVDRVVAALGGDGAVVRRLQLTGGTLPATSILRTELIPTLATSREHQHARPSGACAGRGSRASWRRSETSTVKDYVQKILQKLEAPNRTQPAVKAVRPGL
jgi:hypothetical protein